MSLNKILFYLIVLMILIFACNCSTNQAQIKNNEIDNTITGLKSIEKEEINIYKKTVLKDSINKLEIAKEINTENIKLKNEIKSNEKFVKAGKFIYIALGLFIFVSIGLIVFKIFKPFT